MAWRQHTERVPLCGQRDLLRGKGKLGALLNDRYPDIEPTGVRDYVRTLTE